MHTLMILMALVSAFLIRWLWQPQSVTYPQRWQRSLFYFLFPPLLLVMTAMAVLGMGKQGEMFGLETDGFSYSISGLFLLGSILILLGQFYQQARSRHQLQSYPLTTISETTAKLLPTSLPYSAQIGGWHSQLVISEGLLTTLDEEHLQAVIAHENAHLHYRDTFWFFWLGWVYRSTAWLPQSRLLWEELLSLRELRADWKATATVDPLLLAESLITLARFNVTYPEVSYVALSCTATKSRLEERIEALINQEEAFTPPLITLGRELLWALTPLATIPWHQG
ncbi:MAG: M56 family metallopeptidase [Halothece sp.]